MKGRYRYGVEAVHFREGGVMLRKEYDIISAVSRFRLRSQAYGVFFFFFPFLLSFVVATGMIPQPAHLRWFYDICRTNW